MLIISSEKLTKKNITALLYGVPGTGKTSTLAILPGRKLIIDADRGTGVLLNREQEIKKNVDILPLSPDLSELRELPAELAKIANKYDYICVDSLSELERTMLAILGRGGKNGGAPELGHYNQVNFRLVDFCRTLRALPTSIVFTAWEDKKEIISTGGEKYTQNTPMLTGKTADNICGICNIVGNIRISGKDGQRYIQTSGTPTIIAKDAIWYLPYVEPQYFLREPARKEEKG